MDSVVNQTLRDIEVICVDDGSTDECAAILAERAARDPRIHVITQANAGQGAARNRGLERATGEYVYFMDADDALADSNELAYLVGEAERDSLDMLFFDAETRIDPDADCTQINANDYIRRRDYSCVWTGPDLFVAFCAHHDYTVSPCLVLSRRDFLLRNRIRFAEGVIHEDNVFMLRAILAARRTSHRRRQAYVRYVHAGTTMTKPLSVRNLRGYVACYCIGQDFLARGGFSRSVRRAIAGRSIRYWLQIRKIVRRLQDENHDWNLQLTSDERTTVSCVLRRSRFLETLVATWCCLQDRGLAYTLRRIVNWR